MLTGEQIKSLFEELNELLREKGEIGEVGIVGGAVMCLVFNARQSTRDVDAIFEPAKLIRELAVTVGERHSVGPAWLNDAAKAYIQGEFSRNDVLNLSNLRVWAPDARYMLAMKCLSARWDTHDRGDVVFLIRFLKLKSAKEVFRTIEAYFPRKRILPKTQFLIEEIFDDRP